MSNHGVTIQNAKWCGQLSLGSRGEPWGRGHPGPPTILQLCLWPSGKDAEPSVEAGPRPGPSSAHTGFVASESRPQPLPGSWICPSWPTQLNPPGPRDCRSRYYLGTLNTERFFVVILNSNVIGQPAFYLLYLAALAPFRGLPRLLLPGLPRETQGR